ncbi:hypothetical protein TRIP_B330449 [uncultured Desulfatiglans sp.]|nr:hypothetical protein TRIP_B330449 [uncultured Desulfatiglans sp.]
MRKKPPAFPDENRLVAANGLFAGLNARNGSNCRHPGEAENRHRFGRSPLENCMTGGLWRFDFF